MEKVGKRVKLLMRNSKKKEKKSFLHAYTHRRRQLTDF